MHVIRFLTETQNAQISSVTLLKIDSIIEAIPAIMKALEHSKEIFAVDSVFKIVVGGRLESSNILKGILLKAFY